MIIIHHNDADGHCAAAIVSYEIAHDMEPKRFIEYSHGKMIDLKYEDINDNERVFIVDLALDKNIMFVIKKCLKKNCSIVHIDHHAGGKIFAENLQEYEKILYERVTTFYNDSVSGCLLTKIYAAMTDKEKVNPMDVPYDFTEDGSHFAFYPNDSAKMREYLIPPAVRFINDQDTWQHKFGDSKYFNLAYTLEDNSPEADTFWPKLLYDNDYSYVAAMISTGEAMNRYQEKIYFQANRNGFEASINGYKGWIVNCPIGNSFLFGNKYKEYDFVCKYSFDGSIGKWRYALYSKNDSEFDCGKVCRETFNGNGHVHAAGGILDYNYFHRAGSETTD